MHCAGPALGGMSDADLAAVELRVGSATAADNGGISSEDVTPQANGGPTGPTFTPGDRKSGPQVKLPFGSASVPPWLTHWRLKLALSSASQYQVIQHGGLSACRQSSGCSGLMGCCFVEWARALCSRMSQQGLEIWLI